MSLITVRDLAVDFGSAVALAGVDLDLEHGQLVAVVGPSGIGQVNAPALPRRPAAPGRW